jgi:O-antigen ligase
MGSLRSMPKVRKQEPVVQLPGKPAAIQVRQYWILTVFLCLVFATGGSSWPDEPHLVLLRPAALMMAAYALLTIQREQWRRYKAIWLLLGAVMALTLLHLVPLPPQIWKLLPGRDIIADIDEVAGLGNLWRPLSMYPEATSNAAYSLAVPIAVALLAAQLDDAMHRRLLLTVLALAIISGAIGLVQAAGVSWHPYDRTTPFAGLFINRNHQAVLLAMIIPMTAAAAALHGGAGRSARIVKFVSIAIAAIVIPLVIMTGSRSGVIAGGLAIACLPLFWPDWLRRGSENIRRNAMLTSAWLSLILAIGAFCYVLAASRDTVFDRFQNVEANSRLSIWSSTTDMLGHYFPWGSGIGSYARVYQILEPANLLEPKYTNHAHNEWLEIALTGGVPGLVILAVAALLLGLAVWRSVQSSTVPNYYNRLGMVAIFMLAMASTFDYPARTPIHSAMLALVAIWAASGRKSGDGVAVE